METVSHGRTSGYLNPKVHRPILQFACLDADRPKRYAALPIDAGDSLATVAEGVLIELLAVARVH